MSEVIEKKLDLMEEAIALSNYHFDNTKFDPKFDEAQLLGRFVGDWADDVQQAIETSTARSLSTRNIPEVQTNIDLPNVEKNEYTEILKTFRPFEKDFFDKTDIDYENYKIINKMPTLGPQLMKIFNSFQFDAPATYTLHIQKVGQVFPYHIDFFHRRRWANADQNKIIRIQVMLTDWEPGQVLGYGNGIYTHWKAGEFHTFDHVSTPHWTANANYKPRVSLLITGVKSEATEELLRRAALGPIVID